MDNTYYTLVTARQMISHLQVTCGRLYALDVLALQNKMQYYHTNSEGIPEYINKLKDTQSKYERAKNPITDATLVIITTNSLLSTAQYPQANEDWEEPDAHQRTWERWKTTYRTAAKKAAIKNKAAGGK